jgi:hypothetical protein
MQYDHSPELLKTGSQKIHANISNGSQFHQDEFTGIYLLLNIAKKFLKQHVR